ncbi:MAG: SAM-dependent methyltransferase [Christensenellales bacterium]
MPRLFIVATPIGNLSDISARALQTLRDCDLIAAEDTRVTRALLNHFEINTPCVSNHQHNEENRAAPIVARMLEEDLDVALVTDAGTPCISDPGSFLAKEAAAAGISAGRSGADGVCALSVGGLTRGVCVYGFLPRQKRGFRKTANCTHGRAGAVAHESPHRVIDLVSVTKPCRAAASAPAAVTSCEKTIRGRRRKCWLCSANEKAERASTAWCSICMTCMWKKGRRHTIRVLKRAFLNC